MLDSAVHRLDHYPVDNTITGFCTTYIRWIVNYPVDSAIQLLNN